MLSLAASQVYRIIELEVPLSINKPAVKPCSRLVMCQSYGCLHGGMLEGSGWPTPSLLIHG
jgi:hypothetical protein